jgi:hypothetical protein
MSRVLKHLPLSQWPEIDRCLFERAFSQAVDPFDDDAGAGGAPQASNRNHDPVRVPSLAGMACGKPSMQSRPGSGRAGGIPLMDCVGFRKPPPEKTLRRNGCGGKT